MPVSLQEKGQGLVEYALIFVLVIMILIVLLYVFGLSVGELYSNIIDSI